MAKRRKNRFFHLDAAAGRLHVHRFSMSFPRSRAARMAIGVLFIIGGCLGFLPVLGFWMVPVGLVILSHDNPMVRRFRRRSEVAIMRRLKQAK
ncbi:hypothetical protein NAC44_10895 [Allorhizobium sp. BGMRC 0089]|nr:hypothetical protein [Allorhizobium sonneratiae]MCM2292829.1 hypothetical protein [Allorhizobium sonneratiae]